MIPTRSVAAARAVSRLSWVLPALSLFAGACAGAGRDDGSARVAVFAASSLTEAFRQMETAFEAAHPDVDVVLTFAGSQVLRLQLEQGARADVFASANEAHALALAESGLAAAPMPLARNRLAVVVPLENPAGLSSFEDLPRARRLVIGTPSVPVGVYTRTMLERAGARFGPDFAATVRQNVVSEESNVRLIRAKVELGEADAAIVYRTDAIASDRVRMIDIPDDVNAPARYVIATLTQAAATAAFVSFVHSDAGRAVLARNGFDVDNP